MLEKTGSAQVTTPIDLTLWQTFGDVDIVNAGLVNLTTDGLFDDDLDLSQPNGTFNVSGNPAGVVEGFGDPPFLNEFLGVSLEELDGDTFAVEGSAIKTMLNVKAGDRLNFVGNFLTNETSPETFEPLDDFSFLMIGDQLYEIGTPDEALTPSTLFDSETGAMQQSFIFQETGSYHVGFGVSDREDFIITSALSISDVTLTSNTPGTPSVPEPALISGFGLILSLWGITQILKACLKIVF